jgi:hypothetical protein
MSLFIFDIETTESREGVGLDAPFSLGNNVRAVFHHRAHRDHREGALVRILGKEVWMRI